MTSWPPCLQVCISSVHSTFPPLQSGQTPKCPSWLASCPLRPLQHFPTVPGESPMGPLRLSWADPAFLPLQPQPFLLPSTTDMPSPAQTHWALGHLCTSCCLSLDMSSLPPPGPCHIFLVLLVSSEASLRTQSKRLLCS